MPSRRCGCSSIEACLVREGASYRPVGPIEVLDIPETLHALIAARLDGLTSDERTLLQEAAVVGKTFSKESLSALCDLATDRVEEFLTSLVEKGSHRPADRPTVA